jgi:hypothetical protein
MLQECRLKTLMLPRPFIPAIASTEPIVGEHWERQHLAVEFRQEVQYRQEFDQYCQWYAAVSATHQRELAHMRRDINILGWFNRFR